MDATPNHHPPKMDVLPTIFLQIILASQWLVQHSNTSPKQQQRLLPSLLSDSSAMESSFNLNAVDNTVAS